MTIGEPPAPHPAAREDAAEEDRAMLEHAEQVWQRQLDNEEAGAGRTTRAGLIFRCVLLALAIAAIVFVLFQRLAQLD